MALSVQAQLKDIYHKIRVLQNQLAGGGGGGEANTGSNRGAGVGTYDSKVGVDLRFRSLVAASALITIALDAINGEIDLDVDPSQIDLDDLGDVDAAAPNDGDVLTWDAGDSAWEAQAGGAGGGAENSMAHRRSGRSYTSWEWYTSSTMIINRDYIYAIPFVVPVSQSFDQISCYVSTARTNGVLRLGIYEDDGDVYPGDLVVGSAALDGTAIGHKTQAITETIGPGLYWLAILSDGDADLGVRAIDYNSQNPQGWYGILGYDDGNFITSPDLYWKISQAYGAMPDPCPGGGSMINNANLPTIMMKVA